MDKIKLPLIPLRDLVIFPHMVMHFDCGRKISLNAIDAAEMKDSKIFLVAQRELEIEDPKREDLFEIGTAKSIVTHKDLRVVFYKTNFKTAWWNCQSPC